MSCDNNSQHYILQILRLKDAHVPSGCRPISKVQTCYNNYVTEPATSQGRQIYNWSAEFPISLQACPCSDVSSTELFVAYNSSQGFSDVDLSNDIDMPILTCPPEQEAEVSVYSSSLGDALLGSFKVGVHDSIGLQWRSMYRNNLFTGRVLILWYRPLPPPRLVPPPSITKKFFMTSSEKDKLKQETLCRDVVDRVCQALESNILSQVIQQQNNAADLLQLLEALKQESIRTIFTCKLLAQEAPKQLLVSSGQLFADIVNAALRQASNKHDIAVCSALLHASTRFYVNLPTNTTLSQQAAQILYDFNNNGITEERTHNITKPQACSGSPRQQHLHSVFMFSQLKGHAAFLQPGFWEYLFVDAFNRARKDVHNVFTVPQAQTPTDRKKGKTGKVAQQAREYQAQIELTLKEQELLTSRKSCSPTNETSNISLTRPPSPRNVSTDESLIQCHFYQHSLKYRATGTSSECKLIEDRTNSSFFLNFPSPTLLQSQRFRVASHVRDIKRVHGPHEMESGDKVACVILETILLSLLTAGFDTSQVNAFRTQLEAACSIPESIITSTDKFWNQQLLIINNYMPEITDARVVNQKGPWLECISPSSTVYFYNEDNNEVLYREPEGWTRHLQIASLFPNNNNENINVPHSFNPKTPIILDMDDDVEFLDDEHELNSVPAIVVPEHDVESVASVEQFIDDDIGADEALHMRQYDGSESSELNDEIEVEEVKVETTVSPSSSNNQDKESSFTYPDSVDAVICGAECSRERASAQCDDDMNTSLRSRAKSYALPTPISPLSALQSLSIKEERKNSCSAIGEFSSILSVNDSGSAQVSITPEYERGEVELCRLDNTLCLDMPNPAIAKIPPSASALASRMQAMRDSAVAQGVLVLTNYRILFYTYTSTASHRSSISLSATNDTFNTSDSNVPHTVFGSIPLNCVHRLEVVDAVDTKPKQALYPGLGIAASIASRGLEKQDTSKDNGKIRKINGETLCHIRCKDLRQVTFALTDPTGKNSAQRRWKDFCNIFKSAAYPSSSPSIPKSSNNSRTHLSELSVALKQVSPKSLPQLYTFAFAQRNLVLGEDGWDWYRVDREFARQGALSSGKWQLSFLNQRYEFSPTYPAILAVPTPPSSNVTRVVSDVSAPTLTKLQSMNVPLSPIAQAAAMASQVASFGAELHTTLTKAKQYRSKARLPVLTYYHKSSQASIMRSAQPLPGITRNRSPYDETLCKWAGIRYIIDARPKANASANALKGGGFELKSDEAYNASLLFCDIENIHVMRNSLKKISTLCRNLCPHTLLDSSSQAMLVHEEISSCKASAKVNGSVTNSQDISNMSHDLFSGYLHSVDYYNQLHDSQWMLHVQLTLQAATQTAHYVHNGASVLIHCSDGWDRTAQLCVLSQVLLDPYYRTLKGFAVLIEKDFCSFGHKFADRCGHASKDYHSSERSPIFIQAMDCMYQIVKQFPNAFEFKTDLLGYLVCHAYACKYGTFLFNTEKERDAAKVKQYTSSVWTVAAKKKEFLNPDYQAEIEPIWPNTDQRALVLWPFYYRWDLRQNSE